ncbi:hypothetical protein SNE40_022219 [Patella caerulea]|uniref:Uncharacterized protein n=1 Tax=Patella caerulea TaxID=87958 RepID=A0AAN8G7L8_PATCE
MSVNVLNPPNTPQNHIVSMTSSDTGYHDSTVFIPDSVESSPHQGINHKSYFNIHELGYSGAKRPKSSPISRYSNSSGKSKLHRPKTAGAVIFRSDCNRVNQLEHEATRRHNFESHLPSKKPKPPAWQKNLDPPLQPVLVGPGYVLSRNKSQMSMVMKDNFFDAHTEVPDSPLSPSNRRTKGGDPERDSLIAQLQEQVNDLTLYLEEERLNHRQTKQKAEELLKDKLEDLTNQHKHHIRDLQDAHQYNMETLQTEKEKEFDEYKEKTDQRIHKMSTEIEFLQGAFESYKGTLEQETDNKWLEKEEELRRELEIEKLEAIQEIKNKIIQEKVADKSGITKDFQRQKEAIKREHKKEIEAMKRRYATVAADLDRLNKVVQELDEVKEELEEVKTSYSETCSLLNTTSRLLTDTKVRLLEYEEQFADKVQLIDDKYRDRIDELMRQNTELRQQYVKKCGQLYEEKAVTERHVFDKVTSAKQAMEELIKVKERSNVNLIASDPDLEKRARKPKTRPSSAPTTNVEGVKAHLSAGETDHLFPAEEFIRPDTVLPEDNPETEQMREDLFSEDVKVFSKEDLLDVLLQS